MAEEKKPILDAAMAFYREFLSTYSSDALCVEQFDGIGIPVENAACLGMGYAPPSWDSLSVRLMRDGYTGMDLVSCGLAIWRLNGTVYDKFRNHPVIRMTKDGETVALAAVAPEGRLFVAVAPNERQEVKF